MLFQAISCIAQLWWCVFLFSLHFTVFSNLLARLTQCWNNKITLDIGTRQWPISSFSKSACQNIYFESIHNSKYIKITWIIVLSLGLSSFEKHKPNCQISNGPRHTVTHHLEEITGILWYIFKKWKLIIFASLQKRLSCSVLLEFPWPSLLHKKIHKMVLELINSNLA